MTRIQTLHTLLEHDEAERDRARSEWEAAQRQAAAARDQARQLVDYLADYRAKWSQRFTGPCAIEVLRHYQSFMARLEQAIVQQEGTARRADGQQQAAAARLRACETRVASVEKLIERRLAAERVLADRREQKATDEAATRAGAMRANMFASAESWA